MFFVAAFVAGFDILLECSLYFAQLAASQQDNPSIVLVLIFIFVPQTLILMVLWYKIMSHFWKAILLMYRNKLDEKHCKCTQQWKVPISYGALFRAIIAVVMIVLVVMQFVFVSQSKENIFDFEVNDTVCIHM